jgi:hypothetical protein
MIVNVHDLVDATPESEFAITNAKGVRLEFDVASFAYLVRAIICAQREPTTSDRLLKFGFIKLIGYAPKGATDDSMTKFEKGLNGQEPMFQLTFKGQLALLHYMGKFSPRQVQHELRRQRR